MELNQNIQEYYQKRQRERLSQANIISDQQILKQSFSLALNSCNDTKRMIKNIQKGKLGSHNDKDSRVVQSQLGKYEKPILRNIRFRGGSIMEIRNPPILDEQSEMKLQVLQSQPTENKSFASTQANTFLKRSKKATNARLTPIILQGFKSSLISPQNDQISGQNMFNNTSRIFYQIGDVSSEGIGQRQFDFGNNPQIDLKNQKSPDLSPKQNNNLEEVTFQNKQTKTTHENSKIDVENFNHEDNEQSGEFLQTKSIIGIQEPTTPKLLNEASTLQQEFSEDIAQSEALFSSFEKQNLQIGQTPYAIASTKASNLFFQQKLNFKRGLSEMSIKEIQHQFSQNKSFKTNARSKSFLINQKQNYQEPLDKRGLRLQALEYQLDFMRQMMRNHFKQDQQKLQNILSTKLQLKIKQKYQENTLSYNFNKGFEDQFIYCRNQQEYKEVLAREISKPYVASCYRGFPKTQYALDQEQLQRENQAKVRKLKKYQDALLNEFQKLGQIIQQRESAGVGEFGELRPQEIFDACYKESLHSQEAFDQMNDEIQRKITDDQIHFHARQIPEMLKNRVTQKKEANVERIMKRSLVSLLFGKSRDALVLKFIKKLRYLAMERKQLESKKQTEDFVKDIISSMQFNAQFQSSKIVAQSKKLNVVEREPKSYLDIIEKELKSKVKNEGINIEFAKSEFENDYKSIIDKIHEKNRERFQDEIERAEQIKLELPPETEEELLLKKQQEDLKKTNELKKLFIENSLNQNGVPLPMLNRVYRKFFPLLNYQLDDNNIKGLALMVSEGCVPLIFDKLYLMNNTISDASLSNLINELSKSTGLKGFGMIKNDIGDKTCESLAEFIESKSFQSLTKFMMKDPQPKQPSILSLHKIMQSLNDVSHTLTNLKVLNLSKLGLDQKCISLLGQSIQQMQALEVLNMSANCHKPQVISDFLSCLHENNSQQLKSLDISYNNCQSKKLERDEQYVEEESVEYKISQFLHHSKLVHLDISGTNMSVLQLKYIIISGIRKSRTLRSVHLSQMNLTTARRRVVRDAMRAIRVEVDHGILDSKMDSRIEVGKVDRLQLKMLYQNEESVQSANFLQNAIEQGKKKAKEQLKQSLKAPIFETRFDDQLIYQRILGCPGMPDAQRWTESSINDCHICNKSTQTFFIWNKRAAMTQKTESFLGNQNSDGGLPIVLKTMYSYSPLEPIQLSDKFENNPVLATKSRIVPMIPIVEFIERLVMGTRANVRNCDDEIEEARYKELKEHMAEHYVETQEMETTFWNFRRAQESKNFEVFAPKRMSDLKKQLNSLIPIQAHQPINIHGYCQFLEELYSKGEGDEKQKLKSLQEETFLCALLLPSKEVDFVIKERSLSGVNYLRFMQPNTKQMSINKFFVDEKKVRKVMEVRYFVFKTSVFKDFKKDSKVVLQRAFDHDIGHSKLGNLFKSDPDDLKKTEGVLKKYYSELKNQFISSIADPKSFPNADWINFVKICETGGWNIVDHKHGTLIKSDIDRVFVAVNYEEEDLSQNDDNSLVRYEFIEIVVRLAKIKFFQTNKCQTVAEATEKMIKEFIIPNSIEQMEWQEFREKELWTLEVDDLFKANTSQIEKLYKKFASNKKTRPTSMTLQDAIGFMQDCQLDNFTDKLVAVAYAMSKSTIPDEMENFEKHQQMNYSEFLEFLGRLAALRWLDNARLETKIERLLKMVLKHNDLKFNPVDLDADISSQSDYDDDWVDEISQNLMQKAIKVAPKQLTPFSEQVTVLKLNEQ